MAGAAVELLIAKLKQVVTHHAAAHLFPDEAEKLDSHLRHLRRFKALPKQRSRNNDEQLTELIRRTRDAVYEAEDAIDAYVIQKNSVNDPGPVPVNIVRSSVGEIEGLLEEIIRCIYTENKSTADSDDDSDDYEDGGTAEINQVGYPFPSYYFNS